MADLGTQGGAPSWPRPTTIIGAMAMMGTVCEAMTKGSRPRRGDGHVDKEHGKEQSRRCRR